jgi:hypothetical protein
MRWYSYLKGTGEGKALLDFETVEDDNIVICQKLEFLTFGKFSNYLEFANYMIKNTPVEKRCYYETIFGTSSQKPYFDIEFYTYKEKPPDNTTDFYLHDSEADESVRCLVKSVLDELNEITSSENALVQNKSHILVFTSHSEERRSYHVIVEGYCVPDYKENKEFHDRVMKRVPEKWKGIVDHSMYKSLQQFRIVGNTKWKSNRYKTISSELTLNFKGRTGWIPRVKPESQEHMLVILFEASLITFTHRCGMLPTLKREEPVNQFQIPRQLEGTGESIYNPLTPDEIREALALCYKYAGLPFGDSRFPYSYLKTIENNGFSSLILLKRHRASTCAICDRVHEHENPYLIIAGENRDVYLDCRRNSEGKKLHVGSIGPTGSIGSTESMGATGPSSPTGSQGTVSLLPPRPNIIVPNKQPLNLNEFRKLSTLNVKEKKPVTSESKPMLKFTW